MEVMVLLAILASYNQTQRGGCAKLWRDSNNSYSSFQLVQIITPSFSNLFFNMIIPMLQVTPQAYTWLIVCL